MKVIGLPELSTGHLEKLCEIAEKTAREHVLLNIPLNRINDISISIDVKGSKPITIDVDLEIILSPLNRGYDVEKLLEITKERVFLAIEKYLRKIKCKSNQ